MKFTNAVWIPVSLVLLAAGGAKLLEPGAFFLGPAAGVLLGAVDILCAVGIWSKRGAIHFARFAAIIVLLGGYYAVYQFVTPDAKPCGCLGNLVVLDPLAHLAMTGGLIALMSLGDFRGRRA